MIKLLLFLMESLVHVGQLAVFFSFGFGEDTFQIARYACMLVYLLEGVFQHILLTIVPHVIV